MQELTDAISNALHCIINYTGIFLNGLLMFLIVFHTPKALRSYAVLLFNFALTDLLACCSALFVMQRIIPSGWSLFYISYGYCTKMGEMACYVGYAFMLHYYAHTLISMPISFYYRYHILVKPAPSPRMCLLVCVLAYIPSLFQAVTFTTASDEVGAVRKKMHEMFPAYNLTGAVVTGHLDIRNLWTIYTILYMTLPCGPIYAIVLFFRKKVYTCLDIAEMTASTKKTHKLLMKALTLQACLPGLFSVAVISYGIEQFNFLHHPFLEHLVFQSLGLIPLISPMISLYFVGPYKKPLAAIFGILLNKISFLLISMTDAIELVNDIIHSIVNYTALLFNALLMYLIVFNTPKPLRSYAVLLFNFAITDFLASSSALFVMQRIIPAGWSLFYISYGYCTYLGPLSCYIGYAFMLHCYAHTLLSMPFSFFYRYYVLIKPAPTPLQCFLACMLLYIPSLFQAAMFTTASDDVEAVRKKVHEMFPEYNLTGVVVTGHLDITNVWTIYTILYMTIPSGPVYLTIMYLRRKVYSCLDSVQMSAATKKTHQLLIKALTLQACLPGIFLFAACLYGIEQVELYHHQMLEHAVFHLVGILPCASPLISLYFVVPYRRAILKKYRRLTCKPNVEPLRKIQSTTTGASRGTETSRIGNI